MDKQIYKLPLYTLASGLIIRIIFYFVVLTAVSLTTEWSVWMSNSLLAARLAVSAVLFIFIGRRLCRTYTRQTCFRAASYLVVYSVITLVLEQVMLRTGDYGQINYLLYLPVEIFNPITSVTLLLFGKSVPGWLCAVPSLFAPYLFIFFSADVSDGAAPVPGHTDY